MSKFRRGDLVLLMSPDSAYGVPAIFDTYLVGGFVLVVYRGRRLTVNLSCIRRDVIEVLP